MTVKPTSGRQPGDFGEKKLNELNIEEARSMLYRGITLTDMIVIFRMDRRTILNKVPWGQLPPSGHRGKYETWLIRDVAPYLIKPTGDMEAFIKTMRPADMPPLLQKEYWNGQRAKQAFLEREGQLWGTEKVVATFAEIFKIARTNMLLIPDELQRKAQLTDLQRLQIQEMVDDALGTMRGEIVKRFEGYDIKPGTSGENDHEKTGGHMPEEEDDEDGVFDDEPVEDYDDTFDDPDEL